MDKLNQWAIKWQIPRHAVNELRAEMGIGIAPTPPGDLNTEAGAQNNVRLLASKAGARLWRNNVGVLKDDRGVPVRYGLANETAAMNKALKSSDLIGIGPDGQFIAREVKAPGWKYTGTAREKAQLAFIELITKLGGDAKFTTGEF